MPSEPSALRALPKVDVLAADERLAAYPATVRSQAARLAIDEAREAIQLGGEAGEVVIRAAEIAAQILDPKSQSVINLTGVILHTGLGRARLHPEVIAKATANTHHVDLEFDLETGLRGDRMKWVRPLLQTLTGAEDALVVNNGAGAVHLVLAALGGPVVLSRGQMVEIGGSFRMPDVVAASGAQLIEVGCTNKTHLADYQSAMKFATNPGSLLRCHQSNFRQTGFVSQPLPRELSELAKAEGWSFVDDVGSGCLLDTTQFGLPHERTLAEAIADGADIVIASGDKLLGGPQAGIILGSAELVGRIRSHPIARAVRADKLTLAALAETLKFYESGRAAELPVWEAVSRPMEQVTAEAQMLADAYAPGAVVAEGRSELGGGSLPGVGIPTARVGLSGESADLLAQRLRQSSPPIIGRIEDGLVWLDPRTATPHEIERTQDTLSKL